MAWKHLTHGKVNYFVNLEQVAFLQEYETVTGVVFAAASGDNTRLSISVDQKPMEIIGAEPLS